MGSLPNLNELSQEKEIRRALDKKREVARERARKQDFSRDNSDAKECLPMLNQPRGQCQSSQRNSLGTRRVHRTRSSGANNYIWDDPTIEHMLAYSPVSTRGHRTNTAPPYQISLAGTGTSAMRRRESVNSSIGATSIRRLLTVNRGCRHNIPLHIRTKVAKNFTYMIVAHGLMCAVLVPLFGLQASNSLWSHQEPWLVKVLGPNIGPILLSICCITSCFTSLLTTRMVDRFGYMSILITHYSVVCVFLLLHLYPTIWLLLPGYVLLGVTQGPAWICKWHLVVFFASRITCGQHECTSSSHTDAIDYKFYCNRDERIRRLARWFHAVQDIGIFIGAIIASILITCAASDDGCFNSKYLFVNTFGVVTNITGSTVKNDTAATTIGLNRLDTSIQATDDTAPTQMVTDVFSEPANSVSRSINIYELYNTIFREDVLNSMYDTNERGNRICGSDACPAWKFGMINENGTDINLYRYADTAPISAVYFVLALIALTCTIIAQQVDNSLRYESKKSVRETLFLAGPMAYFIGTEQGYVLGDFTRAFVSCSLGSQMVAGALLGMGLMQLVVSSTLSMLLRHTRRFAVLAAAFFFHACLLLVLFRWRPSKDDSALFYVIAAAWGACNGIWETLLFALMSLTHTNHIMKIASPLQSCRFLGLGITFLLHTFICEYHKILILVVLLVICLPPYAVLEVRLEAQRKSQSTSM